MLVEAGLHLGVAIACGWEVIALVSKRVRWMPTLPTISVLCGRHPWLIPIIMGGLGTHLAWPLLD